MKRELSSKWTIGLYFWINLFIFLLFFVQMFNKPPGRSTLTILVIYLTTIFIFVIFIFPPFEIKPSLKRELIEIFAIPFIILLFLCFKNSLLESANQIAPFPFPEEHIFEILFYDENKFILNNVRLYYDFYQNNGTLSFNIRENKDPRTREFIIEFPSKVLIEEFNLIKGNRNLIENEDYEKGIKHTSTRSYISFAKFNTSLEGVEVDITVKGKIAPNGKFIFYVINTLYAWAQGDVTMKFNLGEYEYQSIPFGTKLNAEPEVRNKDILIRYPADYYGKERDEPKSLSQIIDINTYHASKKKDKDRRQTMALSLVVAIIVLGGEYIRKIILFNINFYENIW